MVTESASHAQRVQPYQPRPEQLARLQRQRQFTRRWIYFPLLVTAILWLAIIGLLLWMTLVSQDRPQYRVYISGIADAVMIILLTPAVLLCAIPAFGPIGAYFYLRRRRVEGEPGAGEKLRRLLWRTENGVIRVKESLERGVLPKMAQPVITAYGAAAYIRTLLREIKEIVSREIDRYVRR